MYRAKKFVLKWENKAHDGAIWSISFHVSGGLFVSSAADTTCNAQVRTVKGGLLVMLPNLINAGSHGCLFSRDVDVVFVCHDEGSVVRWKLSDKTNIQFESMSDSVRALALNAEETVLFTGSFNGTIQARNSMTGGLIWITECASVVECLVFFSNRVFASVQNSEAVALDPDTGDFFCKYSKAPGPFSALQ